ncbi:M20/M25/M40 family metallo-hydrolase [Treponema sp. OttesenSCG-928-L16]|nr:M20/M25/M40 family metallo-hydrolase [Treponema sp. OttesenSCG-928-L16]
MGLGNINPERIKTRLRELCAIPGPSYKERPVLDYLLPYLKDRETSGLSWKEAPSPPAGGDTPNILIHISGKSDPVLLCAHMDTVPLARPVITLIEEKGMLRSDGSTVLGGDDRAGIVLAMEMIELCLADPSRSVSLEVLLTVQEEVGCLGSQNPGFDDIRSALCYNLDGESPPGSLISAAPFKERFTCTVRGRSAHAALEAELGRNAVCHAAGIIMELPQGRIDGESTANIGSIRGGSQTNIVPDEALFTGEVRSFSSSRFAEIKEGINRACEKADRADGYSVSIDWEHLYDGYSIDEDETVIRRFTEACSRKGTQPSLLRSAGGGDANNLNAQGIKTVVFGMGMHGIHTPKEYIVMEELITAAELLKETLNSGAS